jgi:hypothetical protein
MEEATGTVRTPHLPQTWVIQPKIDVFEFRFNYPSLR